MSELIESNESFGIRVLVYQFRHPPNKIPDNYDYALLDSGESPIRFAVGELQLSIVTDGNVLSTRSVQFSGDYTEVADFKMLKKSIVRKEGLLAQLSITCLDDATIKHEFNLIKVINFVIINGDHNS